MVDSPGVPWPHKDEPKGKNGAACPAEPFQRAFPGIKSPGRLNMHLLEQDGCSVKAHTGGKHPFLKVSSSSP